MTQQIQYNKGFLYRMNPADREQLSNILKIDPALLANEDAWIDAMDAKLNPKPAAVPQITFGTPVSTTPPAEGPQGLFGILGIPNKYMGLVQKIGAKLGLDPTDMMLLWELGQFVQDWLQARQLNLIKDQMKALVTAVQVQEMIAQVTGQKPAIPTPPTPPTPTSVPEWLQQIRAGYKKAAEGQK